ncbi:MAG TPA: CRISPR-associated endonuclease Cas2 [Lentisphaeria bacterium]|nr:MAG: CRISPR-associated endonuclease Cas2 [Lentisphaerae bacterium GWF2_50_93]HCE42878.1 CRISPR-associated endonuclease Cas2 [Lentisphaeria bacterium]
MFLLIVYDTERKNCAKLHKALKKYLFWNQNSVFEGTVSNAQYEEIKCILKDKCVPESHIVLYSMENEKLLNREEIGEGKGNTGNIL